MVTSQDSNSLLALAVFDALLLESIFKETPNAVELIEHNGCLSCLFWPVLRNGTFARFFKYFDVIEFDRFHIQGSRHGISELLGNLINTSQSSARDYYLSATSFPHLELELFTKFSSNPTHKTIESIESVARHSFTPQQFAELILKNKISSKIVHLADEPDLLALQSCLEKISENAMRSRFIRFCIFNAIAIRRTFLSQNPPYTRRLFNIVTLKKTYDDYMETFKEKDGSKTKK